MKNQAPNQRMPHANAQNFDQTMMNQVNNFLNLTISRSKLKFEIKIRQKNFF